MYVRATVLHEDGRPADGAKLTWRVPGAAGVEVADTGLVGADGAALFLTRTATGGHLGVGDLAIAAAPRAFDGKTLDYGKLVLYATPRGGYGGVAAEAWVADPYATKAAISPTEPKDATTEATRTLADTLVSAGTQIETAKASTTTVALTEVTVRWAGAAEAESVEATWKEAAPTTAPAPTVTTTTTTPSLLGLTAAAAGRKAAEAGLRLQAHVQFTTDAARHGRVVRQLPSAGAPAPGGVVTVYVARVEGS